jgi:hypothetical protein
MTLRGINHDYPMQRNLMVLIGLTLLIGCGRTEILGNPEIVGY